MNKINFEGPSREEFRDKLMKNSPRFRLLDIDRLPKQQAAGMVSEMGGVVVDASLGNFQIYRGFAQVVDAVTGVREQTFKTSGVDLATAAYAITLFTVGYLGYAVVDYLTKKANFNNCVEAAIYSEYGPEK